MMTPKEFMAQKQAKKEDNLSPKEFMAQRERELVKKSNAERKGFLEDAGKQLKPFALAPLSALTGTIDSFLQGGMHGDDFFSMPSQSNKASDVVDVIREKNPSFKFTNKPQEVAYDVVTSLMGLKPKGKVLELLSTSASKTPGLKTAGSYLSKKLEGVSKYNPANTIITAGTAAAPHLVSDDNPSGKLGASLLSGLTLQQLMKLGTRKNIQVPKNLLDQAGVKQTLADVTQNPILQFVQKKADSIPFMGRTADLKNKQREFLKNKLNVDNSTFHPDNQGFKFSQAIEEALPNIENKTASRVKLLKDFENKIGDVNLTETNKTYKSLLSDVKEHPAAKDIFQKDQTVKFIDNLLKPYVDQSNLSLSNPVYKNKTIPLKTLNTAERLMEDKMSSSPVGQQFKRAFLIDKESAALKNLSKKDHELYLKTKAEAVDYFKNIESEVTRLKGINPEEQNLLANKLFQDDPTKSYKTVSVVRNNISPESIPEYNKVVTQALGTDKDTLQFSFNKFADNVSRMPVEIKKAYFGNNLSNVDEAVSIIRDIGKLDISKPNTSAWKVLKLLTFVGAKPIKGFDIVNTWQPIVNYARKSKATADHFKKFPEKLKNQPNFIKTLSSVLFRPQDDEE